MKTAHFLLLLTGPWFLISVPNAIARALRPDSLDTMDWGIIMWPIVPVLIWVVYGLFRAWQLIRWRYALHARFSPEGHSE